MFRSGAPAIFAKLIASDPELDPAKRAGDTVGALACDALRMAADFLDSVESDDGPTSLTVTNSAQVCRAVAKAMKRAPLANSSRVLAPTDLDGRFFTLTERCWSNAQVASFLLSDTVRIMETMPAADGALKNQLREDAQRLRQVETLVRLAPNAKLGPRLNELMPLLRVLETPREGERPFPPLLIDGITSDPEFWAAAQDAYRIVVGRELDDLPMQVQAVWSGKLAMAWMRRKQQAEPLTEAQARQIDEAVRHPQEPWARAPFVPGDWTDLDPEAAAEVLRLIGARHRVGPARTPLALAGFCERVRTLPLRCYGGVMLIETQGRVGGGTIGIASFLLTEDDIVAIDGSSVWIHDLNDATGPHLLNEEARLDYLRLFMNTVRHEGERFQPVESLQAVADRATNVAEVEALCAGHARALEAAGFDPDGRRLYTAVLCYRQGFFAAALALTPDGLVEMVDDRILAEDVPVRSERMEGLFVILEPEERTP